MPAAVAQRQDRLLFALALAQRIARRGAYRGGSGICLNSLGFSPALKGSEREVDFLTGSDLPGSGQLCFMQPGHEQLPFRQSRQLSSLSIPQ